MKKDLISSLLLALNIWLMRVPLLWFLPKNKEGAIVFRFTVWSKAKRISKRFLTAFDRSRLLFSYFQYRIQHSQYGFFSKSAFLLNDKKTTAKLLLLILNEFKIQIGKHLFSNFLLRDIFHKLRLSKSDLKSFNIFDLEFSRPIRCWIWNSVGLWAL